MFRRRKKRIGQLSYDRDGGMPLLSVDRAVAPAHHAVRDELAKIRDWFDPKVVQDRGGEPFVWMWVTPIFGLMIIRVDDSWYVHPNGFGPNQQPEPFGLDPVVVCAFGESAATVARKVVEEHVQHALATYLTCPPSMWLPPYDGQWASEEMVNLAMDGFA